MVLFLSVTIDIFKKFIHFEKPGIRKIIKKTWKTWNIEQRFF